MKFAYDWDATLVDVHTQEWLPGALDQLRQRIAAGHDVFIHTCRANWPEGHASVEAKLASEGLKLEIVGKPFADVYIDDKAEKPGWASLLLEDWKARVVQARDARRAYEPSVPRKVDGIVVY